MRPNPTPTGFMKGLPVTTLADAITRFDVDVHDHLDRDEIVPVLAGLQRQGDVIIVPAVSDEDAKELFPNGWDAKKPYLRLTKQP